MSPARAEVEKNTNIVMEKHNNTMELEQYIESTLLKPEATKDDISKLVEEALELNFCGVCVPPYYVKQARNLLGEAKTKLVTVVGFPFGYQSISSKVEETRKALEDGADEIDLVINISALKSKDYNHVSDGISGVATMCRLKGKPVKVIIETGLLEEEEMITACGLCADVGVDFVKTSTGFNGPGASVKDVKLLRKILPEKIKIKASGGIRNRKFTEELIAAGANRIGTSSGKIIVQGS